MTTTELLLEYLAQERNNVFCYSSNYLMNTPKKGYEREFREAQERAGLLDDLIQQMADE